MYKLIALDMDGTLFNFIQLTKSNKYKSIKGDF